MLCDINYAPFVKSISGSDEVTKLTLMQFLCLTGNLGCINYLLNNNSIHRSQVVAMIKEDDNAAFHLAAKEGHQPVIECIFSYLKQSPDRLVDMIQSLDYNAFRWAVEEGHLAIAQFFIDYLEEKAPSLIEGMIVSDDYDVIFSLEEIGNLSMMADLVGKLPGKWAQMIEEVGHDLFRQSAKNGRQSTLFEFIVEKLSGEWPMEVKEWGKNVFMQLAENGHLHQLQYLEQLAPKGWFSTIASEIFSKAIENNHIPIVEYLLEKTPELNKKKMMIKTQVCVALY